MPIIKVEMLTGRTDEQKRKLAKALSETFVYNAGGEKSSVSVIFAEVEPANWAVGGKLLSDK